MYVSVKYNASDYTDRSNVMKALYSPSSWTHYILGWNTYFFKKWKNISTFFKLKIRLAICNLHRKHIEASTLLVRNGVSELGIADDEQPYLT
jgi:hypothetical protein